jgi:peptide/nickel transport system permease protein
MENNRTRRQSVMRMICARFIRDRQAMVGAVLVCILVLTALSASVIAPFDPIFGQNYDMVLQNPGTGSYMLGTDELGRDTFSRLVYGSRFTLAAAVIPVAFAMIIGIPIGVYAGYKGGFMDQWVIMRVVDAFQAFPSLILALALAAVLGGGFTNAMIAIGIGFLPNFIRITRSQVMSVRNLDYIQASKSVGCSDLSIAVFHILPNILPILLVQMTLSMASAVIAEAGLSYMGIGASPEQPSWGSMLRISQGYLSVQPWMAVWPGISISAIVLGFNLFGDGLRRAIDSKVRH